MPESPWIVPVDILLIEDNPDDVRATRKAMIACKLSNRIQTVGDGQEALAYLHRHDPYGQAPSVNLVVLDANLPGGDSLRVLEALKTDLELAEIPVILIADSEADLSSIDQFPHAADFCVLKPLNVDQLLDAIRMIDSFSLLITRSLSDRQKPARNASG